MKRVLAGITAIITVFCAFSGCGKIDDETAGAGDSSVTATAESGENTASDNGTTETADDNDSKSYEDVINEYIDIFNTGDLQKILEMQMPEGCADVMRVMAMLQFKEMGSEENTVENVDKYLKDMLGSSSVSLSRIVTAEDLSYDEQETLKEACTSYKMIADYIRDQGGADKVDLDKLDEKFDDFDPEESKDLIKINDAKYVVVELLEDGDTVPTEEEFIIYRINNGSWHMDSSMLGYVKRAKAASADTAANSLIKAANTALIEMDEERMFRDENGLEALDKVLISSDDSRNINVPEGFDVEHFKKRLDNYFSDNTRFDWCIVIDGMCANYSFVSLNDNSQIGIYPSGTVLTPGLVPENDESTGKKSFDELYDICAEILKQ